MTIVTRSLKLTQPLNLIPVDSPSPIWFYAQLAQSFENPSTPPFNERDSKINIIHGYKDKDTTWRKAPLKKKIAWKKGPCRQSKKKKVMRKKGYVMLETVTRKTKSDGSIPPPLKRSWTRCFLLRGTDQTNHKLRDGCPISGLRTSVILYFYNQKRALKRQILKIKTYYDSHTQIQCISLFPVLSCIHCH